MTKTTTITTTTKLPSFHVLNFFHDDEDSAALTVLVNQTRLHIIADVHNLGPAAAANTARPDAPSQEYARLLSQLKKAGSEEHDGRNQSTDSGIDVEDEDEEDEDDGEKVAQTTPSKRAPRSTEDAEKELHQWLLAPLASTLHKMDQEERYPGGQTLEEWYTGTTLFFSLHVHRDQDQDRLEAVELESAPDLQDRMSQLRPRMPGTVPKYIKDLDVPWYSADELTLVHCSASPAPYHPSMVLLPASSSSSSSSSCSGDEIQSETETNRKVFFKTVANADPQPTKREIKLLHQIAKKGLHDRIQCPRLVGIVFEPPSQQQDGPASPPDIKQGPIMGFLQTLIPDPTPLTEKFDSEIPQAQREEWARCAEDMKNILHENGIIWGDAKGDNFVVDGDGTLWIIDFGGSYTEGWVDPEIVETKKGDDMGIEKIVNALHDPVANVLDEGDENKCDEKEDKEEEARDEPDGEVNAGDKRKRSRSDAGEAASEAEGCVKRSRRSPHSLNGAESEKSTRYCYCGGPSAGTMIGCDGESCEGEWFHLECTDLASLPGEIEPWFCRSCKT